MVRGGFCICRSKPAFLSLGWLAAPFARRSIQGSFCGEFVNIMRTALIGNRTVHIINNDAGLSAGSCLLSLTNAPGTVEQVVPNDNSHTKFDEVSRLDFCSEIQQHLLRENQTNLHRISVCSCGELSQYCHEWFVRPRVRMCCALQRARGICQKVHQRMPKLLVSTSQRW